MKRSGALEWRWAALINGFKDATAYRWEFILEFGGSAIVPAFIQWILWYAMFKIGGATEIAGMNYSQLMQYTLASVLFSQIRGGNHDFELQEMIRSGQLSNYLLRPVGVVEFVYIQGVAGKLLVAALCFVGGIALALFMGWDPLRLCGAMVMALIGNVIHYQIGAALSTTAFLWEEAYSVLMVKNLVVSLLSGELIPLTLFPANMQWIWKSTPFYLYVFGPAQYALGHWSHQYFAMQMGLAVLWMLVGWALVRITWSLGMRRYLSLGG